MVLSFKKFKGQLKYKRKMFIAGINKLFLITELKNTKQKVLKNAKQNVRIKPGVQTSSGVVLKAHLKTSAS